MTLRSRFLHRVKRLPTGPREVLAGTRLDLLEQGAWPAWLDRDMVMESVNAATETRHEAGVRRDAVARLERAGHWDWAQATLGSIAQGLAWRLQPNSPDHMAFLHALTGLLIQAQVGRAMDGRWDMLDLPFVPAPDSTLLELWNCPIHRGEGAGSLGHFVLQLEKGGMAHAVLSETKIHLRGAPFPEEGPLATDLWTIALLDAGAGETTGWGQGAWIEGVHTLPLQRLLGTYGRGDAASALVKAMHAMEAALEEVLSIGGHLFVQVFGSADTPSSYRIAPDGAWLGDDEAHPWAEHAFKGAIVDGLIDGGALLVDKLVGMQVDGQWVRETCAAQLAAGVLTWLDADTCRRMFHTDHATGAPLPPIPGRIYRSGPGI
jgi:hypothetical protein